MQHVNKYGPLLIIFSLSLYIYIYICNPGYDDHLGDFIIPLF